jgi:hypothetical protein
VILIWRCMSSVAQLLPSWPESFRLDNCTFSTLVSEAAYAGSAVAPMIRPVAVAASPSGMILLAFMVSNFFPWLGAVK